MEKLNLTELELAIKLSFVELSEKERQDIVDEINNRTLPFVLQVLKEDTSKVIIKRPIMEYKDFRPDEPKSVLMSKAITPKPVRPEGLSVAGYIAALCRFASGMGYFGNNGCDEETYIKNRTSGLDAYSKLQIVVGNFLLTKSIYKKAMQVCESEGGVK